MVDIDVRDSVPDWAPYMQPGAPEGAPNVLYIVMLVSDNGASGEGGPNGSVNENKFFNGIPDDIEENLRYLEELGSPATYNHYPVGWAWAFNTPFKMWKRHNFEGGVADPLLISWPRGIKARGDSWVALLIYALGVWGLLVVSG